jgi:predicted ATP-dependent endonuclease of OLD family
MPLRFNSANPRSGETVEFGAFTVLVGPNNSGKSQTLRDLKNIALGGEYSDSKLFTSVDISMPTVEEMKKHFTVRDVVNSPTQVKISGIEESLVSEAASSGPKDWPDKLMVSEQTSILQTLGKYFVSHLHAGTRFSLTAEQECYDLEIESPKHALHEYFKERKSVQPKLRSAFKEAFGSDIALDYSAMKRWYFKVGNMFGELPDSFAELQEQLRHGELLKDQGDGYQSFTAVVMAALTFPARPLLLDEPEAFLHPKQARVLGRFLAQLSTTRTAQIVVSTHSADFLWGVVSGSNEAHVLRLNRIGNKTTFTKVPAATITALTKTPLLSSQPVLDALFHRGVVVCEGDPDRALYQAVAHKVVPNEGGAELLFIHTNGKDAANVPIELLRQAGAPVCAVVDIDILNSDEPLAKIVKALTDSEIEPLLKAQRAKVSEWVHEMPDNEFLQKLLNQVSSWLEEDHKDARTARKQLEALASHATSKWDEVKKIGIEYFKEDRRSTVEELIAELARIGVFVVPCGELEGWIKTGASKGKRWNRLALESIQNGNCPPDLSKFVGELAALLLPPESTSEAVDAGTHGTLPVAAQ